MMHGGAKIIVDLAHQPEVLRALAPGHMVEARAPDRRQPALPDDRQPGMVGPYHRFALRPGSRHNPFSGKKIHQIFF
jgi:hypothetical protein